MPIRFNPMQIDPWMVWKHIWSSGIFKSDGFYYLPGPLTSSLSMHIAFQSVYGKLVLSLVTSAHECNLPISQEVRRPYLPYLPLPRLFEFEDLAVKFLDSLSVCCSPHQDCNLTSALFISLQDCYFYQQCLWMWIFSPSTLNQVSPHSRASAFHPSRTATPKEAGVEWGKATCLDKNTTDFYCL